jgi:YVTN family beta-propeller protein
MARAFTVRRAALMAGALPLALMLAAGAAQAQSGPFVYVPNNSNNTLSIIDQPTNTVSTVTGPFAQPQTAAVRGDESLVYLTNFIGNSVSVFNTGSNRVVGSVLGA